MRARGLPKCVSIKKETLKSTNIHPRVSNPLLEYSVVHEAWLYIQAKIIHQLKRIMESFIYRIVNVYYRLETWNQHFTHTISHACIHQRAGGSAMSQGPNRVSPVGQVDIQGLIGTSVKWNGLLSMSESSMASEQPIANGIKKKVSLVRDGGHF
jgi:hypothetical protein